MQRAIERLVATPLARWKVANATAHDVSLKLDLDARGQAAMNVAV